MGDSVRDIEHQRASPSVRFETFWEEICINNSQEVDVTLLEIRSYTHLKTLDSAQFLSGDLSSKA